MSKYIDLIFLNLLFFLFFHLYSFPGLQKTAGRDNTLNLWFEQLHISFWTLC